MVGGLLPGDPPRVGPYRLVGRLEAGGMGQVFLARSAGGRLVAVKVIRPELASDAGFRARFAREISAARQVSGLFTAVVVDADVTGEVPWLATGYVAGPSLDDAVKTQGPLPVHSVLILAAGLAEGLQAIHAAGMVHRDLKPSNVLLAEDGPRVIDFGISRAAEASVLTQTGTVMGSPGFMSPEQAEGRQVGPPSDVFSLGAVLAFAATGEGPFGTGSTPALMYRVVHHQPDTSRLPGPLRSLVDRCLAKTPADRPSPADLLAELGAAELGGDWLPEQLTQALGRYALPDLTGPGTPAPTVQGTPPMPPPTVQGTPPVAPPTVRGEPPSAAGPADPRAAASGDPHYAATEAAALGGGEGAAVGGLAGLGLAGTGPGSTVLGGTGPGGTGRGGTGPGGSGPGGAAPGSRGPGRTGRNGRRRRPGLVWIVLTALLIVGGVAAVVVPKITATPTSQNQHTNTGTKSPSSAPSSSRPPQTDGSGSRSASPSAAPQPSLTSGGSSGSLAPSSAASSSAASSPPTQPTSTYTRSVPTSTAPTTSSTATYTPPPPPPSSPATTPSTTTPSTATSTASTASTAPSAATPSSSA